MAIHGYRAFLVPVTHYVYVRITGKNDPSFFHASQSYMLAAKKLSCNSPRVLFVACYLQIEMVRYFCHAL